MQRRWSSSPSAVRPRAHLRRPPLEMHHQPVDRAIPSHHVSLNIRGLDKNNMPRSGDVMVCRKDTTLEQTNEFDAQTRSSTSRRNSEGWDAAQAKFRVGRNGYGDSLGRRPNSAAAEGGA